MQENIKKEIINKFRIVSFDIFDTLLLRPYVKPTDLFCHIEELYCCIGFAEARIKAEIVARHKFLDCEEVTITQIYNEIDQKYITLKQVEIEQEMQVLYPNERVKKLYKYAIEKGKRVIITSDMYLPKTVVELVLKKNGFTDYEKLYLSSDILKTKHTGSLFDHIKTELSVKRGELVHIGDNEYSDVKMAKLSGLSSIYIEKPISRFLKMNVRANILLLNNNQNNLSTSLMLGLLSVNNIDDSNYWENFGYNFAGPVIYTYVTWLIASLKKDSISNVLCVARDGYSIKAIGDLLSQDGSIRFNYVYIPRSIKLYCDLEYETISQIKDILTYYKDKDNYLSTNTPVNPTLNEGKTFLEQNIDRYKQLAAAEKIRIKMYLNSYCKNDSEVAIVDSISVNLSSQKLIASLFEDKKIIGYYWTKEGDNNDTKDYIYRSYKPVDRSLNFNFNIIEFFMTAPELPIKYLDKEMNPIYISPSKEESARIKAYNKLFTGVVSFINTAKLIIPQNQALQIEVKTICEYMQILVQITTGIDTHMFKSIKHAADSTHCDYASLMRDWDKPSLLNRACKKIIGIKKRLSNG